jgi:hypothetical protein
MRRPAAWTGIAHALSDSDVTDPEPLVTLEEVGEQHAHATDNVETSLGQDRGAAASDSAAPTG